MAKRSVFQFLQKGRSLSVKISTRQKVEQCNRGGKSRKQGTIADILSDVG